MAKKTKNGGKREGAGRPSSRGERKETVSMRLTPTVISYARENNIALGETLEETIRSTTGFKSWIKNRP